MRGEGRRRRGATSSAGRVPVLSRSATAEPRPRIAVYTIARNEEHALDRVERWFAYLTDDLLRRSDHRSVQALEKDIRESVSAWNENPKPFIWVKTSEQILESNLTTSKAN